MAPYSHLIAVGLCFYNTFSLAASSSGDENPIFSSTSRGTNLDGSIPVYKNPKASIDDRVNDLLPRMTLEEKVSQLYVQPFSSHFLSFGHIDDVG